MKLIDQSAGAPSPLQQQRDTESLRARVLEIINRNPISMANVVPAPGAAAFGVTKQDSSGMSLVNLAQPHFGKLTAGKIVATNLSALAANTGTLTIDKKGYLLGGQTGYNTGSGFWMGYSGATYKFSIGDGSTHFITWDGAALNIGGNVTVTGGTITGALTVSTGGHINSGQTAYNTGTGFFWEYNAGTPRMSIGNPAGAHVTWDGSAYKIYNSSNVLVFDSTHLLYNDGTTTIDSLKPAQANADHTASNVAVQVQTGKNACPNPGFELNNVATPLNASLAVGAAISDGWYVTENDSSNYTILLNQPAATRGGNAILIRLNTGITIPANTIRFGLCDTSGKIPIRGGDIISFGGLINWAENAALPAGVTGAAAIWLNIYDVTGTLLDSPSVSNTTPNGGWLSFSSNYTVPTTISSKYPSYAQMRVICTLNNTNATSFSTGTSLYLDGSFDDLYMYIGDPTVAGSGARLGDPRNANPVTASGLRGLWSSGALYSQAYPAASPTNQKIVVNGTLYMGDAAISYGLSYVLGLPNTANTYWVYAYDPTFSGGAVTIYATTADPNVSGNTTYAAANGYVFCGKVTTVVNQTTNNNGSGGGGLPP